MLEEFLAVQAIEERAEDSMRRLIASEFVTLDGVMEAPGHDQHPDGKNAWALRYAGADQQRYKAEELVQAGAILLGRVTYEIFAAFWPTAPEDEGFADRMNALPKYVVSKSLRTGGWQNSSIIKGNAAEKIAELKQQASGNARDLGVRGWVRAGGWSGACSSFGRGRAGRRHDHDCGSGRDGRLWPGPVPGALDTEVRHLALDHPWQGTQPPHGQQPLQDLADRLGDRAGEVVRGKGPPGRWRSGGGRPAAPG